MSYSFKPSDPSVTHGFRRIALDQIDSALASARDEEGDLHARIHDIRKRCKKLRGLLRLVRPAFADYKAENRAVRDAARHLSRFRDRTSMLETLDKLAEREGTAPDDATVKELRSRLRARRTRASKGPELDEAMQATISDLSACRERAAEWTLTEQGFDALEGGLKKTHDRARKAMKAARKARTPKAMHEWRKRVKYHGYHVRLLKKSFPELTEPNAQAVSDLGDLLGDYHDLAEFHRVLGDETLPSDPRETLSGPAEQVMRQNEDAAFALGRLLLAEKPAPFVHRWGLWWRRRGVAGG
ncbi:CHAD domain-containing protein [Citreimonas salinaria]|uniref:CHAD domain-containing protein n=1 Tax=Citreimonas salinaria TaxID=321339 RepID=A0A1H3K150_9RHOB|nr:CHAD domain-containing protein [Citreimonas salinaria]SDY45912.1 CHAD domain-containing protein [Citreimonas salinaria]